MNNLLPFLLLFLLASCNGVISFDPKGDSAASDPSTNGGTLIKTAGLYPSQILDGQQVKLEIKLKSPATTDQTVNYQILDSDENPATGFFVAITGSVVIPAGQDSVSAFLTSIPNSVPTGTEDFIVKITGVGTNGYNVGGGIKVQSSVENPILVNTVSITTLENNSYANIANQSSYDVGGVCSYEGGNVLVTVGSVSQSAVCTSLAWSLTLNLSSLSTQGTLVVRAEHSGGTNVTGTAERSIVRDTVAPTLSISTAPSTVVSLSNQNAFALSGTCTEGTSVMISVTSSGGGGTVTDVAACASSAWLRGVNVSTLNDGTLTVSTSISDLAGNTANDSETYTKNTIAPTLAITSPVVTDTAINTNYTNQSVTGTCNKSGATITLTGDVSGTLTATCNGTNFSFTGLTVTGADGFKSIYATMTDAYGNTAYANTILNKHITLPTAVLSGTPAATSPQQVLNVTVGGTLVTGYKYKLGDNTLDCSTAAGYSASFIAIATAITDDLAADGNKKLCVIARDTYGNEQPLASATSYSWVKDTTAPTIAISTPAANSYVNAVSGDTNATTFRLTGTCGIEGTNNVTIQGNINSTIYANCTSGAWSAYVNFSSAAQGPVFVLVSQTNPANGNVGQDSRIFFKDTVLPTIAFSTPNANSYINKANFTASNGAFRITGTCDEYSATPNVKVTGGTSEVNVACSGSTWEADVPFADNTEATPTVTVEITDIAGNKQTAQRSFIQDTVLPSVAVTSTANSGYVNNSNKSAYSMSGTCSDAGTNKVVIKNGTTTLSTVNCTAGSPNTWTASLNLSAISDAASLSLTVEHTETSTNVGSTTASLVKDTVAPAVAWATPLENVCVSASTAGTFDVTGTCTDGDNTITITSTTPTINETATCSGGTFTKTLNINTSGLTNQQSFSVTVAQADTAGNSANGSRSFKFITGAPALTFGGWEDVYAIGKKTYLDGTATENGKIRFKWHEWPSSNVCIPNAVRVYRSETPTGSLSGTLISSDIPSDEREFEDDDLAQTEYIGKDFYYGLKAEIAGTWVDVNSSPVSELRVIAPPNNMALVHRWISNQEVCGLIGSTPDEANNYRCPYTGRGNVGNYHDLQHDLLVDRQELGCNVNSLCGGSNNQLCVATNFSSVNNPSSGAGIAGAIGAVYYNNTNDGESGNCYYKYDTANTAWRYVRHGSLTSGQLAAMTTSEAHAPPLAYTTRDSSWNACQQQTVDLASVQPYSDNTANVDATPKRLIRKKEFHAAASWGLDQEYPTPYTGIHDWIHYLESGSNRSGDTGVVASNGRSGKCNTNNNRHASLSRADRAFNGGYEIHQVAFETGSKIATTQCQSRYGIQDLVGNLWEWGSDEVQCSNTYGDTCVGLPSSKDPDNTDMSGFAWNEVEGPGDRRYLNLDGDPGNDVTTYFTTDSWVLDATARNGTNFFNAVLGLPLMSDDGGGSVSIAAFSAAGHFHGDYINLSPQNTTAVRGVLLGGNWGAGSNSGRWASAWSNSAANSNGISIGARCVLPVK